MDHPCPGNVGWSAPKDPFYRAAFPWQDEGQCDDDLVAFYRRATALRHRYPALRVGAFQRLHASSGVYAFARTLPQQCAMVIVNVQTKTVTLDIDLAGIMPTNTRFRASGMAGAMQCGDQRLSCVTVPARDAAVLVSGGIGLEH